MHYLYADLRAPRLCPLDSRGGHGRDRPLTQSPESALSLPRLALLGSLPPCEPAAMGLCSPWPRPATASLRHLGRAEIDRDCSSTKLEASRDGGHDSVPIQFQHPLLHFEHVQCGAFRGVSSLQFSTLPTPPYCKPGHFVQPPKALGSVIF